ncbi:unnamed protein product [Sphagnum balticum]
MLQLCLLEYIKFGGLLSQKLEVALGAMMESPFWIGPKEPSYRSCCDEDGFVVQDFGYRSEDGHSCGKKDCSYGVPKQEGKSSLMANTIDLMSSALDLITGFAHSLSQEAEGCAPGDMTSGDLDLVFIGIAGAFSEYIPETVEFITPGAVGHALRCGTYLDWQLELGKVMEFHLVCLKSLLAICQGVNMTDHKDFTNPMAICGKKGTAELLAEDAAAEQHHKGFALGMNWGLLHQLDAAAELDIRRILLTMHIMARIGIKVMVKFPTFGLDHKDGNLNFFTEELFEADLSIEERAKHWIAVFSNFGSVEVMLFGDLHLQGTPQITAGDGGLLVYSSEGQGGRYTRAAEADSEQLEDSCQTICGSCESWRFSAQATSEDNSIF